MANKKPKSQPRNKMSFQEFAKEVAKQGRRPNRRMTAVGREAEVLNPSYGPNTKPPSAASNQKRGRPGGQIFHGRAQGGSSVLTGRRPFESKISANELYNASLLNDKGDLFFTFEGEKKRARITTYNDIDYLTLHYNVPDLSTVTGSDNLLDAMIDEGHVTGHMKEVVAAEKTAFKAYYQALFKALFSISQYWNMMGLLDAPTESDDWTFSAETGPGFNTLESSRNIISTLINRKFIIPVGLRTLIKLFNVRVKEQASYVYRKVSLPGKYFLPFSTYVDVAAIQTLLGTAYTNKGLAKIHMDKYGVLYDTFDPKDYMVPRTISVESPEALELMQSYPLKYYTNAATVKYPFGNLTYATNHSGFKYYFMERPQTPWFAVSRMLQPYTDADHNKYGGWVAANVSKTSAAYANVGMIAYNGTAFAGGLLGTASPNAIAHFMRHPQFWEDDGYAAAGTRVELQGANLGATPQLTEITSPDLNRPSIYTNDRTVWDTELDEWLKQFMIIIHFPKAPSGEAYARRGRKENST